MASTPIALGGYTPLQRRHLSDQALAEAARFGFFRGEVTHSLRMLNATAEEQSGIIASGLGANLQQGARNGDALRSIARSTDELASIVSYGLIGLGDNLDQLHADNMGTHALLTNIWKGVDPVGYQREINAAYAREAARRRHQEISTEYREALKIVRDAAREENQSKAKLMFEEAVNCFDRACSESDLAIDAHLQLGTLALHKDQNLERTAYHFSHALGIPFSTHWVRVSQLLAQVEYRSGNLEAASRRLNHIVSHLKALEEIADGVLEIQQEPDWEKKRTLLERLFERHATTSSLSSSMSGLRRLLDRQRSFTALETIEKEADQMAREILRLRPDFGVLSDSARYEGALGNGIEARALIEKHYKLLEGNLHARRLMLVESISCPILRNV